MSTIKLRAVRETQILVGLACALMAGAQSQAPAGTLVINESRPLLRAAQELEHRYGVPVSYEDADYKFNDDIDHSRYNFSPPRAGVLSVDLSPPLSSIEPVTVATLLQGLLEQNVRSGNPGQFKLIETTAGLGMVPVAVRNSEGTLVPYRSPLDARISFPEMDRDAEDAIQLFCQVTGAASGKKIGLGGGPGVLKWKTVRVGATSEVARDVLARLLTTVHSDSSRLQEYKVSWALLTNGPPGIDALLYLHQVTTEQSGPGGTVLRTPVPR
jgi:hypothetical protein